jgi:hypothetical protein
MHSNTDWMNGLWQLALSASGLRDLGRLDHQTIDKY